MKPWKLELTAAAVFALIVFLTVPGNSDEPFGTNGKPADYRAATFTVW